MSNLFDMNLEALYVLTARTATEGDYPRKVANLAKSFQTAKRNARIRQLRREIDLEKRSKL
jgi:hypothetical protein